MNWTKLSDSNMNFLANHGQAIHTNLIGHSVNKQKRMLELGNTRTGVHALRANQLAASLTCSFLWDKLALRIHHLWPSSSD